MDSKPSASPATAARRPPLPVKIVIAGGFGVGKTTAVAGISEIPLLTTEAAITEVAAEIDRTGQVPDKTTTTVALDFGCITIDEEIKLYLFGTPGQDRFGFMWNDLVSGALGALVIVDTRRLDDCYAAVDYFTCGEHVDMEAILASLRVEGPEPFHDQPFCGVLGIYGFDEKTYMPRDATVRWLVRQARPDRPISAVVRGR